MRKTIGVTVVLLLSSGTLLCAQNSSKPAGDRPSNGALELTLAPVIPKLFVPHPPGTPVRDDIWRGVIKATLTNISGATVRLVEGYWFRSYSVEVLDSSGNPAALTEYGERELGPPPGTLRLSSASDRDLGPLETADSEMNLAAVWKIQPGQAYTIKVRRPFKGEDLDGTHKPIQGDLSATLVIAVAAQ